jgi:hypothetical protein
VKRSKSIKAVELAAAQEGYLAKYRDLTLARSPRNSEKLAINSPSTRHQLAIKSKRFRGYFDPF